MAELRLRATDVRGAEQWRWLLQDDQGGFLADHEVTLDRGDLEYAGFVDLAGFLRERATPDRRLVSEQTLVERVGAWIGERVLGKRVGQAIVNASPVVVRVILPAEAEWLVERPLELAYVDQLPLAHQDVSLVIQVEGEGEARAAKQPVDNHLRLLAVFSLPTGGTALALRRERYALTRLVRRIAGAHGRAIELEVLQYGVTRKRLRDALRSGRGWDVVHFSGHGLAGGLVLERTDGTADLVRTPELVALLRPARQRLKLVTLSSCLSAVGIAAETRRTLALHVPEELKAEATAPSAAPLPGLARELVRELYCAVLAMRYAVVDDFAIALDEGLYAGLLGQDQALARALQLALPEAAGEAPSVGAPAISVATPALFGPLAADLSLRPPAGQPSFNVGTSKVAYFPPEPERFVGRAGALARASTALAPENRERHTAVLLHGMAGAGKTACALELAYRHEQAFGALAWWQAPEQGKDITTSLRDLAVALEAQLEGLKMVHAVGGEAELRRFLPRLTQLLEDQAVLVVLDNLESLLTVEGRWRDPNWQLVVEALVEHGGNSRVVLTTRAAPVGLDGRVLVEPVHALSLDEALLLARELPHLGRLLRPDETITNSQKPAASGVALVRRVLGVVQGHPKLLEMADAEAADPTALGERLDQADAALSGQAGRLEAFFTRGESQLGPEQFLDVLAGWTLGAVGALAEGPRTLFWMLCALEESDRWQFIVEPVWPKLWRRLEHPGEPPGSQEALAPLVDRALVQFEQDGQDASAHYRVHPGVAEAARRQAGQGFQAAVDAELGSFWQAVYLEARDAEGGEESGIVVRAGRGAAPYLLRSAEWQTAGWLLQEALIRDRSPATEQAVLPLLRQIVEAARGTDQELSHAGVLARALIQLQPEEAERQLRGLLERALAQQHFDTATAVVGDLIVLLRNSGRLAEALALVDQLEGYTRRAGLGRWTQLADRGRRLQLLHLMGHNEEVLTEAETLRDEMADLPEASEHEEQVEPWHVREGILQIGALAARELKRWEAALTLNGEVTTSIAARGASDLEVARARFNDYAPLLRLGRIDDARALLLACRQVFEAEGDVANLGKVFNALADLEDKLGRMDDAIGWEQTALRYIYVGVDPQGAGIGHFNLANFLLRAGRDPTVAVAHRLAAVILAYQSGSGRLDKWLLALARDLKELGNDAAIPGSFAALCQQVDKVEGVRFAELVPRLPGPAADGQQALAEVLRLARELPDEPPAAGQGLLEAMEPEIGTIVAAAQGDAEAATALEPLLADLDKTADWAVLAGVLRRVLDGERGEQLLGGLDEVDTQIVAEVLRRLSQG